MGSSGLYLGLGPLSPEGLVDLLSSSFMWLLAGGFRSLLCGPVHRATHNLVTGFSGACDERERERGKGCWVFCNIT